MQPELRKDILAGWNVLVIDDDPGSLEIASIVLRHYGAIVHTATSGKIGLIKAQEIAPRFIISDISMPNMDGWTFIEEIQRDPRTHTIPVIALTAHAMPGYREKALAKGFLNFLTKPFTPSTFIRDLVRLLMDVPEFRAELTA